MANLHSLRDGSRPSARGETKNRLTIITCEKDGGWSKEVTLDLNGWRWQYFHTGMDALPPHDIAEQLETGWKEGLKSAVDLYREFERLMPGLGDDGKAVETLAKYIHATLQGRGYVLEGPSPAHPYGRIIDPKDTTHGPAGDGDPNYQSMEATTGCIENNPMAVIIDETSTEIDIVVRLMKEDGVVRAWGRQVSKDAPCSPKAFVEDLAAHSKRAEEKLGKFEGEVFKDELAAWQFTTLLYTLGLTLKDLETALKNRMKEWKSIPWPKINEETRHHIEEGNHGVFPIGSDEHIAAVKRDNEINRPQESRAEREFKEREFTMRFIDVDQGLAYKVGIQNNYRPELPPATFTLDVSMMTVEGILEKIQAGVGPVGDIARSCQEAGLSLMDLRVLIDKRLDELQETTKFKRRDKSLGKPDDDSENSSTESTTPPIPSSHSSTPATSPILPYQENESSSDFPGIDLSQCETAKGRTLLVIKNQAPWSVTMMIDGTIAPLKPGHCIYTFAIRPANDKLQCLGISVVKQGEIDTMIETPVVFPGHFDGLIIATTDNPIIK